MRAATPLLIALLLAGLPGALAAQAVEGRVVDYGTGQALADVDVYLLDDDQRRVALAFSDSVGLFRLTAPAPGAWRVGAELIGYARVQSEPLQLADEDTVRIQVRMAIDPVVIEDPVLVVASRARSPQLQAFWDRVERGERSGFGDFLYGEDLERASLYASDVLRTVRGVRVVPGRFGDGQRIVMRGNCIPALFVDGMQLNRMRRGESLDLYVSPGEIEGIEVYRGAEQPGGQYYDHTGCGLVLVWTKRGEPGQNPFSWTRLALGVALLIGVLLAR